MSTDLLTAEGLRSAQGSVFAYVSPSRLNCWSKCPRAFAFRYLEGIKTPTTPSLFLGTTVHAALELTYRHRQLGVCLGAGDVARRLMEFWAGLVDEEDMKFDSSAQEQTLQKQAVDLVITYLAQVPDDEPKPLAVEAAVEAPLVDPATGEDLGMPLVGIMDLVLDGPTGPVICDFKTSSRSAEPLEIMHEIQLSSYAWLFRQVEGRTESGLEIRSLIKTKTPKIEIHHYPARTDAHFKRLFAVLHEYVDALGSGLFNYRPGFHCGMCDQREPCSQWSG